MRKYLGIIFWIELICAILSIIAGFIIWGAMGLIVLLLSPLLFAPVVLIYAVNELLDRVEVLEKKLFKKKILTKQDLLLEGDSDFKNDVDMDGVAFCKNCGYQLFKEDKECPICHQKRK